jgi:cobalt-zinc-cadmium efflux system outer membrane protein
MNNWTLLFAAVLLVVVGCDSLDPNPAFHDVQTTTADRTGRQIVWHRQGRDAAALHHAVDELLGDELDVDRAVRITLLGNPRLQAVYERLGIAQADVVQAGLLKNPIIDAELRLVDSVPGTKGILEIGITQNVLDILLIPLRKRLAHAELAVVQAEVTGAVLDTAARTKIAFYTLQAAAQSLALQRDILLAAEARYDVATRLRKAGNITDLALATHRLAWEEAKLAVAAAESTMLQDRERMNVLMGLWGARTTWTYAESLPEIPAEPLDLADIERRAVANSLDLDILRKQMQATAARVGIDVNQLLFPELRGGVNSEREADGEWSVGPAVSVGLPIFDWGQARTAAGQAEMHRLWNLYTATAIEVRSACLAARYRLITARRQGEYYQQIVVPLAERITAETQLQYNAMQIGVFQLLDAKRREIDARRRAIVARRDYWIARTELEQILRGRLLNEPMMNVAVSGGDMTGGSGR